jgi:hypothetical protein
MASDIDDNIIIETSGLTAAVATDVVRFAGATAHFQLIKLAHGICGAANIVSSSSPLPVTIASGMTATISGFTGTIQVQGVVSGYPVAVSGTVTTTGLSASPVYVTTASGSRVEITGGIPLTKTKDAISVFGPSGSTYIYTLLVDQAGNSLSYTNGALNVNISGATISATIPSTVTVVGLSGATAVNVSVGNTANINDTNILTGMTAIYGQVVGLRSDLSGFAVTRPSSFKNGRVTVGLSVVQMDSTGFTSAKGVNIKALSTNSDFIYIGNTAGFVGSTAGYALDPGDQVFLDISNTNKIWLQAGSNSQAITYMAS